MKQFRTSILKTITALALVIAMCAGMTTSLGQKASAASTVTITYMAGTDATINGGSSLKQVVTSGSQTTITTTRPVRNKSGFNFAGWSYTKDSGAVAYKAGAKITPTANITLYPVWQINLAFGAGSGVYINGNLNGVMNVSTYVGKSTQIPSTVPSRILDGKFVGWTDVKGGTTVKYKSGNYYKFYGPTTLWPVFECTVYFRDDNGECFASKKFNVGESVTMPDYRSKVSKSGYEMDGYTYARGNSTLSYKIGSSYQFNTSTNVYPHWKGAQFEIQYAVSQNTCTNKSVFKDVKYYNGPSAKLNITNPTFSDGSKFIGWGRIDPQRTDLGYIDQWIYTSNDKVGDLATGKFANETSFTLYPIYCSKNQTYKFSRDGGIWADTEGRVYIYLTSSQANAIVKLLEKEDRTGNQTYSTNQMFKDIIKGGPGISVKAYKLMDSNNEQTIATGLVSLGAGITETAAKAYAKYLITGSVPVAGPAISGAWFLINMGIAYSKRSDAVAQAKFIDSIYKQIKAQNGSCLVCINTAPDKVVVRPWNSNLMLSGNGGKWYNGNDLSADMIKALASGGPNQYN